MRCVPTLLLFTCCTFAALGCGTADDAPVEAAAPVETAASASPTDTPISEPASSGSPTPDLAGSQTATDAVTSFTAPFPNRVELFEPPQRAQGVVRHDEEHGAMVELKGFIDVDEPRVVLSIDGVVSSIPEGGEKYGVQVISIEPPTVVLQRGRTRWPATLE